MNLSQSIFIFFIILGLITILYSNYSSERSKVIQEMNNNVFDPSADKNNKDYKNSTYLIEGQYVTLSNGEFIYAPSSEGITEITTKIFGNEVKGDFNNDEVEDIAFLLTQDGGGSGTFFYVTVALGNKNGGYRGLNAIFLGDRIAPQTTEFRNGEIIVNFAVRKEGEPMTARPSEGVSRYFKVRENTLFELPNKV